MGRYIARRLLWVVVLLFAVSLVTFIIFYAFPTADPATLRAGRQPNPQLVEQIRHALGLDKPWYVQYWRYMKALVLHFDLGRSYFSNTPVKTEILHKVGPTASLTIGAATGSRWAARSSRSRRPCTGSASSRSTCSRTTSGSGSYSPAPAATRSSR